jgi:hypothetical protein
VFGLREIDKREIGTREKEEKWLLLLFGAAKKQGRENKNWWDLPPFCFFAD